MYLTELGLNLLNFCLFPFCSLQEIRKKMAPLLKSFQAEVIIIVCSLIILVAVVK